MKANESKTRNDSHIKLVEELIKKSQMEQNNRITQLFDDLKKQNTFQMQNLENKIINDTRSCLKKEHINK